MPHLVSFGCLVLLCSVTAAAAGDPAPFKITANSGHDQVEVQEEKDKTIFSVRSPTGIGQALVQRTGDRWPTAIDIRLHLKGLESFEVSSGNLTLAAAVSSQDGKVRLWQQGKEDAPLAANSAHWMPIRIVDGDGKAAKGVPPGGGYFELTLPRALFEGNPKSIKVRWIDFYRN